MKTLPGLSLKVDDIPAYGLGLELDVPAEELAGLLAEDGQQTPAILSPLTGRLALRLTGGGRLSVKGSFKVAAEINCDRCLAETAAELSGEIKETLFLAPPGAAASEDDPEADDDGALEVIDGRVDLSPLLGEYFWLAWPWHFICKSDCAGLCPRCGADLNHGLCQCAAPEAHPNG